MVFHIAYPQFYEVDSWKRLHTEEIRTAIALLTYCPDRKSRLIVEQPPDEFLRLDEIVSPSFRVFEERTGNLKYATNIKSDPCFAHCN